MTSFLIIAVYNSVIEARVCESYHAADDLRRPNGVSREKYEETEQDIRLKLLHSSSGGTGGSILGPLLELLR